VSVQWVAPLYNKQNIILCYIHTYVSIRQNGKASGADIPTFPREEEKEQQKDKTSLSLMKKAVHCF